MVQFLQNDTVPAELYSTYTMVHYLQSQFSVHALCAILHQEWSQKVQLKVHLLREHIRKKASFFRAMSKGVGVQPECKSFEVFFLSPILTTFWTLNGGRGG